MSDRPMRALVFAAGKGERMRPLTHTLPKPLLPVGGKPLIVWHLEKLAALGVREVVINTSWLADRFAPALGDGAAWGLRLHYLYEGAEPLETGGGMLNALPWLGSEPFLAIAGDVFTDFDFARLPREPRGLAHLVMVENPPHHPDGDFRLDCQGRLHPRDDGGAAAEALTFAGIGVYHPGLIAHWREAVGSAPGASENPPRFKLRPLFEAAMANGQLYGQKHSGHWTDVGTPERLAALDARIRTRSFN